MWKATRITADAAEKLQINAGLLLKNFNVENPVEPKDEDIICDTTGDFSISSTPTMEDFFADINNAPLNTLEGVRVTGWTHTMSVTSVSVTEEMLRIALNASETEDRIAGIVPGEKPVHLDSIYWIGDMADPNKLLVIRMKNVLSTNGISFTSRKDGKGGIALNFRAHEYANSKGYSSPVSYHILMKTPTATVEET